MLVSLMFLRRLMMRCEGMGAIDEHYKQQYFKLLSWVEGLGEHLDDWDKLCDCDCQNGVHSENCLTSQVRKDLLKYQD